MAGSVCATGKIRVRIKKYALIYITKLGLKFITSLLVLSILAVDSLSEGKKSMQEKTN